MIGGNDQLLEPYISNQTRRSSMLTVPQTVCIALRPLLPVHCGWCRESQQIHWTWWPFYILLINSNVCLNLYCSFLLSTYFHFGSDLFYKSHCTFVYWYQYTLEIKLKCCSCCIQKIWKPALFLLDSIFFGIFCIYSQVSLKPPGLHLKE